ncbi:MAG: cytochrome d ubiquinol oxidase subunit II, partial [Candidatus Omnitrophica bacterium]|nr:cytochrome d ubiquinol oxidase subunit II [Candidatus Omnitrophota bacterium]
QAQAANIFLLVAGVAVFLLAELHGYHFAEDFFTHPVSIGCFIAATFATLIFWRKTLAGTMGLWKSRLLAATQVGLVLMAWLILIYPNVLFYKTGGALSLFEAAAPEITIRILGWSLIIGSVFFLPMLYYLFRVFKLKDVAKGE